MIAKDFIGKIDLLDTMTQYPSILTYHTLGERGIFDGSIQVPFKDDDLVYAFEKINGRNTRIIFMEDGTFFVGSRSEIIYYSKDMIENGVDGILESVLSSPWLNQL